MNFFMLLDEQFRKIRGFVTNRQDLIGGSNMMSAVVYGVVDTRMIKKRKNLVSVRLLAAIKEKEKTSQDKISRV